MFLANDWCIYCKVAVSVNIGTGLPLKVLTPFMSVLQYIQQLYKHKEKTQAKFTEKKQLLHGKTSFFFRTISLIAIFFLTSHWFRLKHISSNCPPIFTLYKPKMIAQNSFLPRICLMEHRSCLFLNSTTHKSEKQN